MNLHYFVTQEQICMIAKAIESKEKIEIENKYKNHEIWIKSSNAGVDFYDGTKEGDYIVLINYSTTNSGIGGPVSGKELKELKDTNNLIRFIDNFLERRSIEGYETIGEGQISLFEMMI